MGQYHDIHFFVKFSYPRVKYKILHIFLLTPLGPLKRDCDTNHYIPVFKVDVAFNHDNELYWGSTTR